MKRMTNKTARFRRLKFVFYSCLILSSFAIGLSSSGAILNTKINMHAPVSATTEREIISIYDNSGFTAENGVVSGTGNETDPYIIANWNITGPGDRPCIEIRETTAFFIIRDCVLSNGENAVGIRLGFLHNGFLFNNTISDSFSGIQCQGVMNVNITNNYCFGAVEEGISIIDSANLQIRDNIAHEGQRWGIFLMNTSSCLIYGNFLTENLWDGIRLESVFSCTLQNNYCVGNLDFGIILYYSEDNTLIENDCGWNGDWGIAFVFDSRDNQAYGNNLYNNGAGCIADDTGLNSCFDNYCSSDAGDLQALFSVPKITFKVGEVVEFTDLSYGGNENSLLEYSWNFGDGNTSNYRNPSHTYEEIGEMLVSLTVENEEGDSSSFSLTLYISDNEEPSTSGTTDNTDRTDSPFGDLGNIGGYSFWTFSIVVGTLVGVLFLKTRRKRKRIL